MIRLIVFGSGRGTNFDAIYKSIESGSLKASIELVMTENPDAQIISKSKNRDLNTMIVPLQQLTREEHEIRILDILKTIEFDLIILAGYMRILSEKFISEVGRPILNIHPSLLPSFPGLRAQKQAIEYGVKVSGCTVHLVTPEVDAGPILGQRCVKVLDGDDEDTLSARILKQEHQLYPLIVSKIAEKNIDLAKFY